MGQRGVLEMGQSGGRIEIKRRFLVLELPHTLTRDIEIPPFSALAEKVFVNFLDGFGYLT